MTLQELEARFAAVTAEPEHYHDQQLGMVACQEALVAAQRGNYGVGAVLVNPRGTVVGQGQNTVFYPHFRSDLHAEMVVRMPLRTDIPRSTACVGTRCSAR